MYSNMIFSDLKFIAPELYLLVGGMVLLLLGAFFKNNTMRDTVVIMLSFLLIGVAIVIAVAELFRFYSEDYFDLHILANSLVIDRFGIYSRLLVLIAGLSVMIVHFGSRFFKETNFEFEIPVLMLISMAGMMLMISSASLISLYMAMEMMSLPFYIMAASSTHNSLSSEAGMKYFILGTLASGMYLFGASLIYGFTGEVSWQGIFQNIDNTVDPAILFGLMFILVAFAFKISAAPFHMWTPDVYQGSPTIITTFMASASKIASVCMLARLLYDPFYGIHNQWQQVIIVIAIVSMFIGSFGALMQTNLKRLLAYSSIGHVGFILAGLACSEEAGVPGVLIYLTIYLTQTIIAFASVIFLRIDDNPIVDIEDLKGLHKAHPFMAFILAVVMFSMAGIPPLAGFFAKLFILQPLVASKLYATAVLFVIASVIACFYYLRIVKFMYFDTSEQEVVYAKARGVGVLLLLYTAFNLFFILAPTDLLTITQAAFEAFGSAL